MDSKNEFIQRCAFWADKGGKWKALNQANESGQMGPEAFEYHVEKGPSPSIIGFTIYGLMSEHRLILWKGYHYWNEIKSKSEYLSLGANGEICTGETFKDLDMYFIIMMTNGQAMHILNHDEIKNQDQIKSTAKALSDGQWQLMSVLEWSRITEV